MMKLIVLAVVLCGLVRVQAQFCKSLYPGAECLTSCPDNFKEEQRNFPYCYSGNICCRAKPTTPTTTTTTTTTTTAKPTLPPQRQCGIDAIAVSGRIMNVNQTVRFSEMECAWPWVISLYIVIGGQPYKSCNGVLLSKTKFLSASNCFQVPNSADWIPSSFGTIKAHVGRCNVTGIQEAELLNIGTPVKVVEQPDLVVVEFSQPILSDTDDWNLNLLPVCLPDEDTEFRTDEDSCVIASRSQGQGIVVSSRVSILDNTACDNIRSTSVADLQPEGTFCTSYHDGFSIDAGDHGGVVMCPDQNNHWTLKGVISKGRSETGEATDEIVDIEPIGSLLIDDVFGSSR